ncbi:sericin-2-like isoform X2 [Eurosta solidaginis]|uniref:sericin-2-like isoform X2 n=1 Tax=Eurosta solidaginis TaxID=178769 RepID=UPI003530CB97
MLHYNLGEHYPQLLATQQRKRFQQQKSRRAQQTDEQTLLLQEQLKQQKPLPEQQQQQKQQQQSEKQQQQPKKPVRVFRVHYYRINSKDGCGGLSKSTSLSNISINSGSSSSCSSSGGSGNHHGGIGATNAQTTKMKTIAPNIRRRRRCDKHHLELAATAAAAVTSVSGGLGAGPSSSLCVQHGGSFSMPTSVCSSATTSTATSPIEDIALPAPPITPPPAFLSAGYKRSSTGAKNALAASKASPAYKPTTAAVTSNTSAAGGASLSTKTVATSTRFGGSATTAAAKVPSSLSSSSTAGRASGSKVIGMRRILGK